MLTLCWLVSSTLWQIQKKIHRISLNITIENERCCSCMYQFIITLHCSLHKTNWRVWDFQLGLSWQTAGFVRSRDHISRVHLDRLQDFISYITQSGRTYQLPMRATGSRWLSLTILTTDWLAVHLMAARQDVTADVATASVILSRGVHFIDGEARDSS